MGFCLLVGWFLSSTSCVLLGTFPSFNIFVFLLIKKKKKKKCKCIVLGTLRN